MLFLLWNTQASADGSVGQFWLYTFFCLVEVGLCLSIYSTTFSSSLFSGGTQSSPLFIWKVGRTSPISLNDIISSPVVYRFWTAFWLVFCIFCFPFSTILNGGICPQICFGGGFQISSQSSAGRFQMSSLLFADDFSPPCLTLFRFLVFRLLSICGLGCFTFSSDRGFLSSFFALSGLLLLCFSPGPILFLFFLINVRLWVSISLLDII